MNLRILIIDNYDSYTFNLYQLLCAANAHCLPVVIRNDQFSWPQLQRDILPHFDCVVISPGPGRPDVQADFGVCAELLRSCPLPILGVCLGHQGIASCYGGQVVHAPQVMHGLSSDIHHTGQSLFADIPSPFSVIRYHSLVVHHDLPDCLEAIAWTFDGDLRVNMGIQHKHKPIWGVQFHPESICTTYGHRIAENFVGMVAAQRPPKTSNDIPASIRRHDAIPATVSDARIASKTRTSPWRVRIVKHARYVPPEQVFAACFQQQPDNVWLDSARVDGETRWSYMGDLSGPQSFQMRYSLESRTLTLRRSDAPWPAQVMSCLGIPQSDAAQVLYKLDSDTTFLQTLDKIYQTYRIDSGQALDCPEVYDVLPDFCGGFAGYLGYEMKRECLAGYHHSPPASTPADQQHLRLPDAVFSFLDRLVAFDHVGNAVYLVSMYNEEDVPSLAACQSWAASMSNKLEQQVSLADPPPPVLSPVPPATDILTPVHDRTAYLDRIAQSQQYIDAGETYEVCMTTQFRHTFAAASAPVDAFAFYRQLRRANPAPYAAFMSFSGIDAWIACSSPERFLRLDDSGWVTMKPIKGTAKRSSDPDEDERRRQQLGTSIKDRAENLMRKIVDLIRNDLNVVSEPNSVSVDKLMQVETYETVHQLVTTVRGKLRSTLSPVAVLEKSFPPGSMTGAPKVRTVEILDRLEQTRRGVYSGCLGFLSVSGAAHFNVVIRTVVGDARRCSVGAGGAIISLSDPEDEWSEVLVKLGSVASSVHNYFAGSQPATQ
ncbi:para-aminobenzoate synthase, (PABA) [Sorochytrium milnesiophthora]